MASGKIPSLNIRVICRSAIALAIAVIRKKLKLFYSSMEFKVDT